MSTRRAFLLAGLLVAAPMSLAQNSAAPDQAEAVEPAAPTTVQQADPPAQPDPKPGLILRELLVLQTDRYDDTANNSKLIPTTLPAGFSKTGRAKRTDDNGEHSSKPMPLGLITFEGAVTEPVRLRLELPDNRGRFHAHRPGNGRMGKQMLEWPKLLAADSDDRAGRLGGAEEWLSPLRDADDRLWLQSHQVLSKERFLLYDVSLRFKPAIELDFENNTYQLKSNRPDQAAPPIAVLIRSSDMGWSADAVAAPWPGTTAPIAKKAGNESTGTLKRALAPIKELLLQRGHNANEAELALDMIASAGLEEASMSLVYVMPVGVIDQHIELKIKPRPDQITRTTIVVVNNVDPELGSRINALLDDLGSDEWAVRERAHKELLQRSKAAIKKIQQLKNHEDPEIAFRAQQILEEHNWKYGEEQ